MDIGKKEITEDQEKIKYAVEWHTELDKFILVRASWSYKGPGHTFTEIQKATEYRDAENMRVAIYGKEKKSK